MGLVFSLRLLTEVCIWRSSDYLKTFTLLTQRSYPNASSLRLHVTPSGHLIQTDKRHSFLVTAGSLIWPEVELLEASTVCTLADAMYSIRSCSLSESRDDGRSPKCWSRTGLGPGLSASISFQCYVVPKRLHNDMALIADVLASVHAPEDVLLHLTLPLRILPFLG